jgi:hypothetical protein
VIVLCRVKRTQGSRKGENWLKWLQKALEPDDRQDKLVPAVRGYIMTTFERGALSLALIACSDAHVERLRNLDIVQSVRRIGFKDAWILLEGKRGVVEFDYEFLASWSAVK